MTDNVSKNTVVETEHLIEEYNYWLKNQPTDGYARETFAEYVVKILDATAGEQNESNLAYMVSRLCAMKDNLVNFIQDETQVA